MLFEINFSRLIHTAQKITNILKLAGFRILGKVTVTLTLHEKRWQQKRRRVKSNIFCSTLLKYKVYVTNLPGTFFKTFTVK